MAYSELSNSQYPLAYNTYCKAAADKSFPLTPAFRTNRALARLRKISSEEDFKTAREDLNQALATDANYLPALYRRAMLEHQYWLYKGQTSAIANQAIADIGIVLNRISPNGEFAQLHLDAAQIYAAEKPVKKDTVLEHLRLAVLTGGKPKTCLDNNPLLPPALGTAKFQEFYKSLPDQPDTSKPLPTELVTPNPIVGWLE